MLHAASSQSPDHPNSIQPLHPQIPSHLQLSSLRGMLRGENHQMLGCRPKTCVGKILCDLRRSVTRARDELQTSILSNSLQRSFEFPADRTFLLDLTRQTRAAHRKAHHYSTLMLLASPHFSCPKSNLQSAP